MEIFKIIGIGIITVFAYIIIKQFKPEFAIMVGLTGSIILLFSISDTVISIINNFTSLVNKTGVSPELFSLILKIIGIGYLTEFAANLCVDSGCTSIADKILLAGKVLIMIVALPIISSLIDVIVGLLWERQLDEFFLF